MEPGRTLAFSLFYLLHLKHVGGSGNPERDAASHDDEVTAAGDDHEIVHNPVSRR